eukprot:CAMPEP_0204380492 /NCGR_PEP_ID=MMETSP0469-20131031/53417_1 /ASSEMBLY_ACC=CAM_ASM_000384 /TAXON_ID=2969 /ORGANISM="Oxyrrhis marina" /LENGTH=135 /DNA_ID=CAMNT_0051372135 /DNA_START=148 /DNA_END=555 /DNA_ORIENTATION=+
MASKKGLHQNAIERKAFPKKNAKYFQNDARGKKYKANSLSKKIIVNPHNVESIDGGQKERGANARKAKAQYFPSSGKEFKKFDKAKSYRLSKQEEEEEQEGDLLADIYHKAGKEKPRWPHGPEEVEGDLPKDLLT